MRDDRPDRAGPVSPSCPPIGAANHHGCEWRGWFKEGSAVPLEQVLSLASERRF